MNLVNKIKTTLLNMTNNDVSTPAPKKSISKKSKTLSQTDAVLPRAPFIRTVKYCAKKIRGDDKTAQIRFTGEAMSILQEDVEKQVISLFRRANIGRAFSKRKTLHSKDVAFARLMRDEIPPQEADLEVE